MDVFFSVFDAHGLPYPPSKCQFDSDLLQARLLFYDYITTTARSQWEVNQIVKQDLHDIATLYGREHRRWPPARLAQFVSHDLDFRTKFASILPVPPSTSIANDLDSRVVFAEESLAMRTPYPAVEAPDQLSAQENMVTISGESTPSEFYKDGRRYTTDDPPLTEIVYPWDQRPRAGLFAKDLDESSDAARSGSTRPAGHADKRHQSSDAQQQSEAEEDVFLAVAEE